MRRTNAMQCFNSKSDARGDISATYAPNMTVDKLNMNDFVKHPL